MDALTFIASVIGSLAWPAAVVAVAWALRPEIRDVLQNLESLQYGKFEARFGRQIEELRTRIAPRVPRRDTTGRLWSFLGVPFAPELVELAEHSPRAAVLEAWLLVEDALRTLAQRYEVPERASAIIIRELRRRQAIDPETADLAQRLSVLRNEVAHAVDARPTAGQAIEFAQIALGVAEMLRRLENRRS